MTKKEQMDYVREEAKEQGVPFKDAWHLFVWLGESEMFDGFITGLEDMAADYM
jgi:hypothetical protein